MMRVGLHLSTAKGLSRTAQTAVASGCQAIQIFSGSPTSWRPSNPVQEEIDAFRDILGQHDIGPVYLHVPYLVNPAAPNPDVWSKSIDALASALSLANRLGANYVVTHLGSHVGTGPEAGIQRIIEAFGQLLQEASAPLLLMENNPGSRNELGSCFEEIATILDGSASVTSRLGVCLDTAHLWGAGYDLSTAEAVSAVLAQFDQAIGLDRLRGVHANDSTLEMGSHRDLHTIPGQGQIGIDGFRALTGDPRLSSMSYILELPRVSDDECAPVVAEFKRLATWQGYRSAY